MCVYVCWFSLLYFIRLQRHLVATLFVTVCAPHSCSWKDRSVGIPAAELTCSRHSSGPGVKPVGASYFRGTVEGHCG